ncbi:hypothetical protein CTZ27_05845 [Streptomyces griseocarneus]|nr:hypothetical protein CTZ27_05845 [Streptomyces griseocarneus]
MGWTVLYIAFGIVALWLLGEVLLQYKARLRWRLLAFGGFLGVVAGVLLSSVPVISAGAIAFAVGQTYVTLSFRRGFAEGWAIRRGDDADSRGGAEEPTDGKSGRRAARSGRRRGKAERNGAPTSGDRTAPPFAEDATGAAAGAAAVAAAETAVMPQVPAPGGTPAPHPDAPQQPGPEYTAAYEETAYLPTAAPYADGYGNQAAQAPAQDGQFDYGQGQYAAYSDPYIGSRQQTYEQYDAYGQQQYGGYPQQQYGQDTGAGAAYSDPYAPSARYDTDTPPGGIWVPQQRDTEPPHPPAPHPQGGGYDGHYDGQQHRY